MGYGRAGGEEREGGGIERAGDKEWRGRKGEREKGEGRNIPLRMKILATARLRTHADTKSLPKFIQDRQN